MDDNTLYERFSRQTLSHACWNHDSHVRMAWILLQRSTSDAAITAMRDGLIALNAAHGTPDAIDRGYHETLTVAWMRIIEARISTAPRQRDSESFCRANPDLFDKTLMRRHYSSERILSEHAKRHFVEPDREPLPSPAHGGNTPK